MREKKQKKAAKNWYKVLAIVGCIFFAVVMVLQSMGTGWLSMFSDVRPGDVVTIDYTIRDLYGDPLVTTDLQMFQKEASAGKTILYSKQLQLQANQSAGKTILPVPVYSAQSGWSHQFAFFDSEFEAISSGIVGMKKNEEKNIGISLSYSGTKFMPAADLNKGGVNLTDVHIGDMIIMGVSENQPSPANTTEPDYSIRIGEIAQKNAGGIVVNYGYSSADVRIVAINGR
jgi:hypothetical protein